MSESNSVFISYRRSASAFMAQAVYQDLIANGIDSFYDIESINAGQFDTVILNQIEARPYFLPILTPGTLNSCLEPGDWVLHEIQHALKLKRMIVPLHTPEFRFSDFDEFLPPTIAAELKRYNAVEVPHRYFRYAMQECRTRFLKPLTISTTPTPPIEATIVAQKLEAATAEPEVSETQLSAQEHFERAELLFQYKEWNAAINEATEAIRLDPDFAEAYLRRSGARIGKSDYDGAIADATMAIQLNALLPKAYSNRGIAHAAKGDLEEAIRDYDQAIQLAPTFPQFYFNRGVAHTEARNFESAAADYTEALRLNPLDIAVYLRRGRLRAVLNDYMGAVADFEQVLTLRPDYPQARAIQSEMNRWAKEK